MQRKALKERILDHAEARLWEQGYRGMRVDELARDVGISKRTLYEQFRTKEEIARDALSRRLRRLDGAIDNVIAHQPDQARQLGGIVKLICEVYAKARPPFYRDLETTPALTELVEASRTQSYAKLESVIRSGIETGRFRAVEPSLARRAILAMVGAIVRPETLAQEGVSMDAAHEALLDLVLCGLETRSQSRRSRG
jgi:AcrR family transcriptional regulator